MNSHTPIRLQDFYQGSIGVFGFGREGKSTYNYLLSKGISPDQITIFDLNEKLTSPDPAVTMHLGKVTATDLDQCDVIFKTAGASPHQACFQGLNDKLTTQTQFFFDSYTGKVIGVTGTKGKSTTAALIYKTLETAGKNVVLAGNMGVPILEQVNLEHPHDWVVLELSSYQLAGLRAEFAIGVLINLYPEHHIDRHNGRSNYYQAKINLIKQSNKRLLGHQIATERPKIYAQCKTKTTWLFGKDGTYRFQDGWFQIDQQQLFTDEGMQLQGLHNRYNACAALAVCDQLALDTSHLATVLQEFSGLSHRLEDLGVAQGIRRIDDAISTTPESTIAALETFQDRIDTIFLGGKEGGYDFTALVSLLQKYQVSNIILFPDTGTRIKELLDEDQFTVFETNEMQAAVTFAADNTSRGSIALLSCASPSYSLWKDFEEKGDLFKAAVNKLRT